MKEIWENKIPVVDINVKPVFQGEQALINWVNIIISIKIYLYSSIYCNFFFKSFQKSGIEAIALSEFVTPGGDPLITINYKPLFPAKTNGWLFYKFNPWKPRFNQFLQRCLEAGLIKHYQDLTLKQAQILYYQSDKEKNVVKERSSISPMTLEDLQVNLKCSQLLTNFSILSARGTRALIHLAFLFFLLFFCFLHFCKFCLFIKVHVGKWSIDVSQCQLVPVSTSQCQLVPVSASQCSVSQCHLSVCVRRCQ